MALVTILTSRSRRTLSLSDRDLVPPMEKAFSVHLFFTDMFAIHSMRESRLGRSRIESPLWRASANRGNDWGEQQTIPLEKKKTTRALIPCFQKMKLLKQNHDRKDRDKKRNIGTIFF